MNKQKKLELRFENKAYFLFYWIESNKFKLLLMSELFQETF